MSAQHNISDIQFGVSNNAGGYDSSWLTDAEYKTTPHIEQAMKNFKDHAVDAPGSPYVSGGDAFAVPVGRYKDEASGKVSQWRGDAVRIQGKSGKEGRAQRGADYNKSLGYD